MVFASRKSRMRAPHHRRTEEIGACLADPFANGGGRSRTDTFTIPEGRRRRVYRPKHKFCREPRYSVNAKTMSAAHHPMRTAPGAGCVSNRKSSRPEPALVSCLTTGVHPKALALQNTTILQAAVSTGRIRVWIQCRD